MPVWHWLCEHVLLFFFFFFLLNSIDFLPFTSPSHSLYLHLSACVSYTGWKMRYAIYIFTTNVAGCLSNMQQIVRNNCLDALITLPLNGMQMVL